MHRDCGLELYQELPIGPICFVNNSAGRGPEACHHVLCHWHASPLRFATGSEHAGEQPVRAVAWPEHLAPASLAPPT